MQLSYKYKADSEGKNAVTLIEECKPVGNNHALLRLRPLTGRTHQLRIHCVAIGHPIVGDKLYTMDEIDYMQWRDNPRNFMVQWIFIVMLFIVNQSVLYTPIRKHTAKLKQIYLMI